jgi:hypothetical protein
VVTRRRRQMAHRRPAGRTACLRGARSRCRACRRAPSSSRPRPLRQRGSICGPRAASCRCSIRQIRAGARGGGKEEGR